MVGALFELRRMPTQGTEKTRLRKMGRSKKKTENAKGWTPFLNFKTEKGDRSATNVKNFGEGDGS